MHARALSIVATAAAVFGLPLSADEGTSADIVALDAVALRDALASGRISAADTVAAYLARIAALDEAGPRLGAIIETNPEAPAIAHALDSKRLSGASLGALHGVPVLLKANIDTRDRLATSAGSLALAHHRAAHDAAIVALLRDAGAVILGKTNLSEWANFRSSDSTSGWSSVGLQTRHPYVLDRNPCGSSSGSAVAVAARLAPLAVGTETDGSIVCPAATNGVVGVKPTRGRVSGVGIVPLAASQDTVGPIARTAADAALLLKVLAPAWGDAADTSIRTALPGLRIGVLRDFDGAGTDAAVEHNLATVADWLRAAGAELIDPIAAAPQSRVRNAERVLLLFEFRDGVDRYLEGVRRGPRSLNELISYNMTHETEVMPHFGQDLLIAARDVERTSSLSYDEAKLELAHYERHVAMMFAEQRLDALLAPANARAWRTDWQAGDRFTVGSSSLAATTGYPSVAVPTALVGELPLGVVLVARPNEERLLLELANEIERRRGPFPEPRFLATVPE